MKTLFKKSIVLGMLFTNCLAHAGVGEIGSASTPFGGENLKPIFGDGPKLNEIECRLGAESSYFSSTFPCETAGSSPAIDVVQGNIAFYTRNQDEYFRPYETDWSKLQVQNLNLKSAVLTGRMGSKNNDGHGAVCKGEESQARGQEKTLIVDGKYSVEAMQQVALAMVIDDCAKVGGKVLRGADGQVAVLSKENNVETRVRALGTGLKSLIPAPRSCVDTSVAIQCDLSERAGEISELIKTFRATYPNHPVAQ